MQCDHPLKGPDSSDRNQIIVSANKALQDYYDDIRANGMLSEFNWLDSSSDFFWVPPGYGGPVNFDSVSKVIRRNAKAVKKIDERWEELKVYPLTSEYVTYTGRISSTVTDSTGKTVTDRFLETGILVKRDNGWKILSGQTDLLAGRHP